MEKKNIDWSNIGFGYMKTDKRYVSNFKNGAWDEGTLTSDDQITISECAGVLQYAQTCFEGMKAYTTEDGHIVTFRPDLNAARDLVNAGAACVMPLGSPIGSNKGICTKEFIQILIDEIDLPIIVDAGIGRPSQACEAMEMGAAAVMANTAIATAGDVQVMAEAFKKQLKQAEVLIYPDWDGLWIREPVLLHRLRDFCTTKDYQIKEKTKCHQIQQNMANILTRVSSMK